MSKELEEAIKVLKDMKDGSNLCLTIELDRDKKDKEDIEHYRSEVKSIETVLNYIESSIPKQVVEEAFEYIEDYFERLNGPDEDIKYIKDIKQELLEGK